MLNVLQYFGKYPAKRLSPLLLGCTAFAAGNVNWRPWNKVGPRECNVKCNDKTSDENVLKITEIQSSLESEDKL